MGAGGSVGAGVDVPSSSSKKRFSVKTSEFMQFPVIMQSAEGYKGALPDKFILRISYESLDFLRESTQTPIVQFPFQNIICWGSSSSVFKFNVFNFEPPGGGGEANKSPSVRKDISFVLKTSEGKTIEELTMSTVRKLMVDIDNKAVSKDELSDFVSTLFCGHDTLQPDWFSMIEHFSSGRTFLAKQCMDLMVLLGPLAPFERVDLACLLYTRILTRDSFQLVVNTFEDRMERENLLHRLNLKDQSEFVTDCTILPSNSPIKRRSPSNSRTPVRRSSSNQATSISGLQSPIDGDLSAADGAVHSPTSSKHDALALGLQLTEGSIEGMVSPGEAGLENEKFPIGEKLGGREESIAAERGSFGSNSNTIAPHEEES